MDLFLRGRGTESGARAPLWLLRLSGAAIAYSILAIVDRLGVLDVFGFSPIVTRLGALVVGFVIGPTALGALLWPLLGLAVAVTMLVGFTGLAALPARQFVRADSASAAVDAIIVLSGSMNDDGRLSGPVLDRLLTAIGEARRRNVRHLALSVIEEGKGGMHVDSERDQRALMTLLAPDIEVDFVHDVASTRDEALRFRALTNAHHWQRIALVTSPLHTRRACRAFETAGLIVECVPAVPRNYTLDPYGVNGRLDLFRDVLYEASATLLYRVRGWI